MTDRPKARHTLEIIIDHMWNPTAYFTCHGDEASECHWPLDDDSGEEFCSEECVYAEWHEAASGIVEGCFEVPLVQVAWGEEPAFAVDPEWIEAYAKVKDVVE